MSLIITGVIDGPLTGGTPKAIELYALSDIADLSLYGIGSANNGGGSDGEEFELFGSATMGEFLYVASESVQFNAFFGEDPDFIDDAVEVNGDDAIELFFEGAVIDTFGEIDVDGSGEPWEYMDGWAYRVPGSDGGGFTLSEWRFSGPNALDGQTENSTATTPFPFASYAPFALNEIRHNQQDADDDEFFEVYSPNPATSLADIWIVGISGEFEPGQIDFAFDLSAGSFDADGIFLIARDTLDTGSFDSGDLNIPSDINLFGTPITYFLVEGFDDDNFAAGNDIDEENDGILDVEPWTRVIDAVTFIDGDGSPDVNYSDVIVGPDDNFTFGGIAARPDGSDGYVELPFDDLSGDTPGALNGAPAAGVFINEFRNDFFNANTDLVSGEADFVEFFADPGFDFSGLTFVEVASDLFDEPDGDSGPFNPGEIVNAVPLDGLVASADGIGAVANPGNPLVNASDQVENVITVANFDLLSTAASYFIVRDFTGSVGDDLDTDDNGVFDTPLDILDGITLTDGDSETDALYFSVQLPPDSDVPLFTTPAAERFPDGTGDFDMFNPIDTVAEDSISLLNDGTGIVVIAAQSALPEGDSGTTEFVFEVVRFGDISASGSVEFTPFFRTNEMDDPTRIASVIDPDGTDDGMIEFPADVNAALVVINVAADEVNNPSGFVGITISNPSDDTVVVIDEASSLVVNDDLPGGMSMESFEQPPGTTYELITAFDDGFFDYFDRFPAPGVGGGRDDFQYGFDGDFAIFGQDLDGEGGPAQGTILIPGLPIAEIPTPQVSVLLGALGQDPLFDNYEGTNGVRIFATVDDGPRSLIGQFSPSGDEGDLELGDLRLDTNFDGIGDTARLTETLVPFVFDLPSTGLLATLEIEIDSNAGFEPIVVDKVTVADASGIDPVFRDVKIHDVQGYTLLRDGTPVGQPGDADEGPLAGEFVRVQGIVTANFQGTPSLEGFYVQEEEEDYDSDLATSEGIFVYDGSLLTPFDVEIGDIVTVEGVATERDGETAIVALDVAFNGTARELPAPIELAFPTIGTLVDADGDFLANLEQYEGMRVTIPEPLSVTELFQLGRFGTMRLSSDGRLEQFTQNSDPDPDGFLQHLKDIAARSLVIDDGLRIQNPEDIRVPDLGEDGILDAGDVFRMGDTYTDLTGVLSFSEDSASGSEEPEYRIHTPEATLNQENPRPEAPEEVGGEIKVASFNVLNFFTTLDVFSTDPDVPDEELVGPSDLDPRGADTNPQEAVEGVGPLDEYERQLSKLVEALAGIDSDVIGLVELENDFLDPGIRPIFGNGDPDLRGNPQGDRGLPIAALVEALNDFLGATIYDWVRPLDDNGNPVEFVGTDAISTGLIYRTDTVRQVGDSAFLVFEEASSAATQEVADVLNPFVSGGDQLENLQRNRPAVAATFETLDNDDGQALTVAVNHFKSKGDSGLVDLFEAAQEEVDDGTPGITQADVDALLADPNFDQNDGAGFWNAVRADASRELLEWLETDPTGAGDPDFLVIGDLNAYQQEEPIRIFEAAGYTDLAERFVPGGSSFVFDGQRGTLDYALANPSLNPQVTGATEWSINADEPLIFDYNLEFGRDPGLFTTNENTNVADGPFRASDHDPIIVGIDFNEGPVAVADILEVSGDGPFEIDVADNDFDPAGNAFRVVGVETPANGTAVVTPAGTILYTPDTGFEGVEEFTYRLLDETGRESFGTVEITVTDNTPEPGGENQAPDEGTPPAEPPEAPLPPTPAPGPAPLPNEDPIVPPVNLPPVAEPDVFVGVLGEPVEGDLLADNGFGRDFDPNFDRIRVVRINGEGGVIGAPFALPSGAEVTVETDGRFVYDPGDAFGDVEMGETVADRFSYRISDGLGGNDFAFVDIELTAPEIVPGTAGDDRFVVTDPGLAVVFEGGSGEDTVEIPGAFAAASITAGQGGFVILMDGGAGGAGAPIKIAGVERVEFDDATLAVSQDADVIKLALVYDAAFDRFGDAAGIGFWAGALEDGATIGELADVFAASDEFAALWGANLTDEEYVGVIYENSLDREPDEGGLDYWTEQLETGALDRGDILVAFACANETGVLFENETDDGVLYLV